MGTAYSTTCNRVLFYLKPHRQQPYTLILTVWSPGLPLEFAMKLCFPHSVAVLACISQVLHPPSPASPKSCISQVVHLLPTSISQRSEDHTFRLISATPPRSLARTSCISYFSCCHGKIADKLLKSQKAYFGF